jgi:3-dehydroquinate dehydratase II
MSNKILVIHGPNLNMLGEREPDIYGKFTLEDINRELVSLGNEKNVAVETVQLNSEGEIVETIQNAPKKYKAIIINPGAYTHYSIAIRDAFASVPIPSIEVHLSNIYKREEFRRKSVIADVVAGQIAGFGKNSYLLALLAAVEMLNAK